MRAKYEDLRKWEKDLILRCHIAGRIKYHAELDSEDDMPNENDGSIQWAEYWKEDEYPPTIGFPCDWFIRARKNNTKGNWRELSAYAKRELAEQQAAIDEYNKRQEKIKEEVILDKNKMKRAVASAVNLASNYRKLLDHLESQLKEVAASLK